MQILARSIGLITGLLLLSALAVQSSMAQSITLSKPPTSLSKGSSVKVKVNYSTNVSGIVAVQLFNSQWKKITNKYENIGAGSGSRTLTIPIGSGLASANNYIWQAVLYTRSWSKLDEDVKYNVRVGGSSVTSSVWINGSPTRTVSNVVAGGFADINVAYESSVSGVIQIQLFDSRWRKIVSEAKLVSAGRGMSTLRVPIRPSLASGNGYIWQAFLADRSWRLLDQDFVYDVRVLNPNGARIRVPLTITRHRTARMYNGEVDEILANASALLQVDDGSSDVACSVQLVRNGNVGVFSTGDGRVDTNAELEAAWAVPGDITVVDELNICEGVFNPSVWGCTGQVTKDTIVERVDGIIEANLWAHEYGHLTGLPHRNSSIQNVMTRIFRTDSRRVSQSECNSFMGVAGISSLPTTLSLADEGPEQELSIEAFVSQYYFDGLPLEQTVNYSSADAVRLFAMLNDESHIQYHQNIALTIGMTGDADAVAKLIAYAENGMGNDRDTARMEFKGRIGAVVGLGYLLNRTGSEQALDYLSSKLHRDNDMRKYAVMGLGLSGTEAARERLFEMQVQAVSVDGDATTSQMSDIVEQGLQTLETVSQNGLEEYHRKSAF